jgi:hypothetical protein
VAALLAANGKNAPERSFDETFAPRADEASTLCAFSSFSAHSVQHAYDMDMRCSNFDVNQDQRKVMEDMEKQGEVVVVQQLIDTQCALSNVKPPTSLNLVGYAKQDNIKELGKVNIKGIVMICMCR